MTFNEWYQTNQKDVLKNNVADILVNDVKYIPNQATNNTQAVTFLQNFSLKILKYLNFFQGNRTLLPNPDGFTNRLTIILVDIMPQMLNEMNKYNFIKAYFNEANFGFQNRSDSVSATGTLPITLNNTNTQFNATSPLQNGYEKNQNIDNERSYDLQETVKREISFGAFWKLDIFKTLINRIEPLLLGVDINDV